MHPTRAFTATATAIGLAMLLPACSDSAGSGSAKSGSASVSLNGSTYPVGEVVLTMETGDGGWFHIDGSALPKSGQECVPGLDAGLSLYGDLPSSVKKPLDLIGKRLRVEFTGDGDDANFCFAGMGGLAGAEDAWITFDSVTGNRVTFSMDGSFKIYDDNGDGPVAHAAAKGIAVAQVES